MTLKQEIINALKPITGTETIIQQLKNKNTLIPENNFSNTIMFIWVLAQAMPQLLEDEKSEKLKKLCLECTYQIQAQELKITSTKNR